MTHKNQQEQMMWKLLAPAAPGEEMVFDGMDLREKDVKVVPVRTSRPGSALADSTGRRVVYGYEKFHQAISGGKDLMSVSGTRMRVAPSPDDKEYNGGTCEGDRVNGMLHGKGWRSYEKTKSWVGTLLPYGSLMNPKEPPRASNLVTYERFLSEPGILSRFNKPVVLVHGLNSIKSVMHCAKVLEMLKFSNGKMTACIMEFENLNTQRVIFAQAKYSAMFQFFDFPIIAVTSETFEFPRKQMLWPHRSLIEERREMIVAAALSRKKEDSLDRKGWRMPHREDVPPEVTLTAKGNHKLNEMGEFPSDVGYERAPQSVIEWFGTEIYAGDFSHGTKHGHGSFARANGDLMQGKFHRGMSHGNCTYYHHNGNIFIGEWVHGKKVGEGEVRTVRMHESATLLQTAFRGFLARKQMDKLHAAEQIRQRAQEKARLSAQQEAAELAIAVAEAKSRILEQSSHEDDDEPVGSRRMGSTL